MADTSNSGNKDIHTLNPDEWVDKHGDYLFNYAYSRVQSRELAEDLVQETFVAGLRAMKSFQGRSSEITWLISILKRKVIDHYRKMSSNKEITSSEFTRPFQKDGVYEGHWIMDRAPKEWPSDLDDPLHQKEFRIILEKCMSHLPDKLRAVFVLKFIEEINSDEVCKELDCTPSNLWVMMHRARLRLRECIELKWLK
jgi:RNA polymerase sigma-70 factor (ECF subfamily)